MATKKLRVSSRLPWRGFLKNGATIGSRTGATAAVFLLLAGCASAARAPSTPHAGPTRLVVATAELGRVRVALDRGDYEEALKLLGAPTDVDGRLLLAELYFRSGQLQRVEATLPSDGAPAAKLRAQVAFARGLISEALATLASFDAEPEIALLASEMRYFYGQRADAEKRLIKLVADESATPEVRGRAAHLLRRPKEANEFYNQAEETMGLSPSLAQRRAELYLEKYDAADAGAVIREAREKYPGDPMLLTLEAELRFSDALDFVHAEQLARAALKKNPSLGRGRGVLAAIALRDGDVGRAEEEITLGLRNTPLDWRLLALRAAARFLVDDEAGLAEQLEQLFRVSPQNARIYEPLAENAEWEHRYSELDALLRKAVRLDRSNGALRGRLGLNLLRFGDESEALVELRESFRLDPYDVRVKNTLELFEQSVKKNYVELRRGPFVFRFPKQESALLERYIPMLAEQAREKYEATYGVKIPRIQVELYASKEEFSVRTSGLLHAGIAGVCFGRKLAAVTPRGSLTNVGMTLWHELAHVFHLELSKSRVPRFVTEGMAEWETRRLHRGWSRELDLELYESMQAGALYPLTRMNQAFTRADSMRDIAVAYYASERLMSYLDETRGSAPLVDLLARLGTKEPFPKAFQSAFGKSLDEIDIEFRRALEKDVARFSGQVMRTTPRGEPEQLANEGTRPGASAVAQLKALELARAQLGAENFLARLEKLWLTTHEPEVALVLARELFKSGASEEARALLTDMLVRGMDGVEVRLLLSDVALASRAFDEVTLHATRAAELDSASAEAYSFLATSAVERHEPEEELRAVSRVAQLSEHNFDAHERQLELMLELKQLQDAERLADSAIWAGLGRCRTHELAAAVFRAIGMRKRAEWEKDSASLVCPPR